MPASNRIVCLLSGPLAAVGRASASTPGVEGELRLLPILDAEAERQNLEGALSEGCADTGRAIELQIRYATVDALRSAVTLGARVVHFSGHGHPEFLCFEDGKGGAVAVSPEQLRLLVSAGGCGLLRLAVCNSCHSQRAGCAFVEAGVPHVVAVSCRANNDGRVSDRAATAFCRAFYLGVIAGRTVRQAFEIGCAAATNAGGGSETKTYVLLPEDDPHDERIFADAPSGCLDVHAPRRTPTNAPAVPTYYLGRDAELFCLVDSMLRHRLTTVAGSFGSGKSALAAAAAHYLGNRGRDFEAVVWARVASRETLVDDVVDAARRVLSEEEDTATQQDADPPTTPTFPLSSASSSAFLAPPKHLRSRSLRPRRTSDEKNTAPDLVVLGDRVSSFSSLAGGPLCDERDDDDAVAAKTSAAALLRNQRVLVVLDNFERLIRNTPRAECQRALASLLSTASRAHVVLTCSRGAGLGRSTSVTERVIKLAPLEPSSAARLLLQRAPELARRATNVKAARSPRSPPHVLVAATAAHSALRRLAGNPFAIALAATLLNALFEAEDAARAAASRAARAAERGLAPSVSDNDVAASNPPPPVTYAVRASSSPSEPVDHPLEPLDRLAKVLDSLDQEDPEIAKLRDEINYVTSRQDVFGTQNPPPSSRESSDPSVSPAPNDDDDDDDNRVVVADAAVSSSYPVRFSHHHHHHHSGGASRIRSNAPPPPPPRPYLDRRTLDAFATVLGLVWLVRILLDAVIANDFSLRLDAVAHLFVDVALLVVLASLLPPHPPLNKSSRRAMRE
ncbi:hypothetical protein CTAYLR_007070 [Chrysophaeum taylorii]|uniref:CHAT domain-containing protein n=1 Tax=Chrysophaeum taylorii TaxID=2483200 RepID=A0AAD7UL27_9STRA|nr:hypothetical protein CTAYLR_007070 [Chrysophaeum taylorii]